MKVVAFFSEFWQKIIVFQKLIGTGTYNQSVIFFSKIIYLSEILSAAIPATLDLSSQKK